MLFLKVKPYISQTWKRIKTIRFTFYRLACFLQVVSEYLPTYTVTAMNTYWDSLIFFCHVKDDRWLQLPAGMQISGSGSAIIFHVESLHETSPRPENDWSLIVSRHFYDSRVIENFNTGLSAVFVCGFE